MAVYKLVTLNEAGNEWVYNVDKDTYFTEAGGMISLNEKAKAGLKDATLTDTDSVWHTENVTTNAVTTTKLPVGAYLVKITDPDGEITYGTLVAETYKQGETYLEAENVTVTAKPSSYTITKAFSDGTDVVVKLGEEVKFEIDTIFPSFGKDSTDKTFTVTDTPHGMKITGIEVQIAGQKVTSGYSHPDLSKVVADQAVTINFVTDDENQYGKTVKVIVTAEITSLTGIKNEAITNHSDDTPSVDQHTAQITLTKKNEDESLTLEGAQFKVYKDSAAEALYFTKDASVDDTYTLCAADADGATQIITASKGSVTIRGIDEGSYHFEEITAPAGYSINDDGKDIVVSVDDTVDSEKNVIVKTDILKDTKLSALPSTGGIGITIFTIVGCLIMIAAASMFFMSRRKSED